MSPLDLTIQGKSQGHKERRPPINERPSSMLVSGVFLRFDAPKITLRIPM